MIDRVQLSALIAVPIASVAVSLAFAGEPLSLTWLNSFGGAVSATVGATTLFDRWAWKQPFLQGWFVKRPVLAGDWVFMIDSLWNDPQTNRRPEPIEAQVTIRQTYTDLHLHLNTPESSGDFVASKIVTKDDGSYQVTGVFRNQPRIGIQNRSRTHLGALVLDVIGEPDIPSEIKGHYWTDRGTSIEAQAEKFAVGELDDTKTDLTVIRLFQGEFSIDLTLKGNETEWTFCLISDPDNQTSSTSFR